MIVLMAVGDWNLDVITLVFVGLVLYVPFQVAADWWGDRHRRREWRRRAGDDTPPTQPGS